MAVLRAIAYIAGTPEPPMPPRDTLGPFEHLVLSVIVSLPNRAYAVPIREALERVGGRPVARGALYTTLARLEAKGLLDSRLGDPEPVRGRPPQALLPPDDRGRGGADRDADRARRFGPARGPHPGRGTMTPRASPPAATRASRTAEWLLRRMAPQRTLADSILGDLREEAARDHATEFWVARQLLGVALALGRVRAADVFRRAFGLAVHLPQPDASPRTASMTSLAHDFRLAWRLLRTRRPVTLVAAATLALGVGMSTAMFSVVEAVLLRPLPYEQADRLAFLWERDGDARDAAVQSSLRNAPSGGRAPVRSPSWRCTATGCSTWRRDRSPRRCSAPTSRQYVRDPAEPRRHRPHLPRGGGPAGRAPPRRGERRALASPVRR
jgi:hypothetical protein